MHCVGEYPTADEKLHASQIDFLKKRYPEVKIGFSTHENPDNNDVIKIAIAIVIFFIIDLYLIYNNNKS